MKNFNEEKFYSTEFGQAVLGDINNDKENLNLKSFKDFPYSNFTELKNDIKNNKTKILSFYNYNILIGIYSGSNKKILHDIMTLIPTLILIISVVLCFVLKDWIFLIPVPINFVFAAKSGNSNNKSYLNYIPLFCLILSIILFYFKHNHSSILFGLIFFITISILYVRKQFNDAITYFSILNESIFCLFYKKDYIFLKTTDNLYIYSAIERAPEFVEKWGTEKETIKKENPSPKELQTFEESISDSNKSCENLFENLLSKELKEKIDILIPLNEEYNCNSKTMSSEMITLKTKLQYEVLIELGYDVNPLLKKNEAYAYADRALVKSELKDHLGAISDLNKVLELNPKYTNAHLWRGEEKYKIKDYHNAILDFNSALEIEPNDSRIFHNLGKAKLKIGNTKNAVYDLMKATDLGNESSKEILKSYKWYKN